MAAPLDEDIRKQIYAMFSKSLPTSVIVERTGVSKSTVKRLRVSWKDSHAHASAPARVSKKKAQSVEPLEVLSVEPLEAQLVEPVELIGSDDEVRDEMARLARDNLSFVAQRAKEGFLRASLNQDEHDRAWMETQYLKVLQSTAVQLGKWAGLDDVPPAVSAISPIEKFAEELAKYRDTEDGGAE